MLVAVTLAVAAGGAEASFGGRGVDRVSAVSARVRLIKASGRGAFTDVAWLPSFRRLAVTYAAGTNLAQGRFVAVIGLGNAARDHGAESPPQTPFRKTLLKAVTVTQLLKDDPPSLAQVGKGSGGCHSSWKGP